MSEERNKYKKFVKQTFYIYMFDLIVKLVYSTDYDMWKYIDTNNYDNEILAKIKESCLPKWNWSYDSSDIDNDATVAECYEEKMEDAREEND